MVSFAIREEGNRNVFGDIVLTDRKDGTTEIIRPFNTSRFEFEKNLSFISNTEIKFVETIAFSDTTYSEETIINLIDSSKNLALPALQDNSKKI